MTFMLGLTVFCCSFLLHCYWLHSTLFLLLFYWAPAHLFSFSCFQYICFWIQRFLCATFRSHPTGFDVLFSYGSSFPKSTYFWFWLALLPQGCLDYVFKFLGVIFSFYYLIKMISEYSLVISAFLQLNILFMDINMIKFCIYFRYIKRKV